MHHLGGGKRELQILSGWKESVVHGRHICPPPELGIVLNVT